jgi:hypothetical protein
MKRHLFFATLLLVTHCCFAQTQPIDKTKHINLPVYLIELEQISGRDSIVHIDSTYGFQITIPKWWHIRETPPNLFGGTFPPVDSIENALVFKCFNKTEFKSIDDFENWVIKDYSIGESPKWSNQSQHRMLLKKELTTFKELGKSYKTQLLKGGKIYDCCYIITQTSTAYIWIDFTATTTTYPKNFDRFKEIVSLFKRI